MEKGLALDFLRLVVVGWWYMRLDACSMSHGKPSIVCKNGEKKNADNLIRNAAPRHTGLSSSEARRGAYSKPKYLGLRM